ncbi:MerR family transcriptional regulator [Nocardia colli]|uniref:MerR family transcriptional regulator n=1 Tax=Nocardia colli TaxID=2545717 RepID=A0A5N0DX82_9NOCA|nr:MerR family transcriptional regulator [Nocardia colli]KAA8880625.1 MerR family transcriptional regulator [Nocardia colli]
MSALVTIGDFSRMTYLSVKALRHYHEVGLLVPADVDAATGYRLYRSEQVPVAQVIRRLRDLGMPLQDVRAVLGAEDVTARNAVILRHLRRMERQLEQTQSAVASLRALLEPDQIPIEVEYRLSPPIRVLAVRDRIGMNEFDDWSAAAFNELHAVLDNVGIERAGPDGALYFAEFFAEDAGDVVVFAPVRDTPRVTGRVVVLELPATELAVTVHRGPFGDLDRTYGALGTFVSERAIGVDGPIRENYLVTADDIADESRHRTEVCWPVFHTVST